MALSGSQTIVGVAVLVGACAWVRPGAADERARLAAALDDRSLASSPEGLAALGAEAASFRDPEVRIAAWLFVAEGLAERAKRPTEGASYASRALIEPSIAPVDRGRAIVVLTAARVAEGNRGGAIELAEREAAVAPGLAQRLRVDQRAEQILTLSRWVLAAWATLGAIALGLEARGGRAALRAAAGRVLDGPVWIAAVLVAAIAPLLARAFDPTVDGGPFFRLALGILLVHATLATGRRYLRPALAASLALGSFAFVAAWAYLGSARPLPAWAAP